MPPDSGELDEFAIAHLKKSGATTGKQLYEALMLKFPYLTENGFADLVQRLAERGQIDSYEDHSQASSLRNYLAAWERNLWFYASIIASVSAALAAYVIPPSSPFVFLRWVLGLLFVLLIPGYVALQAFFPAAYLNALDRFALSVGVSVVLDMVLGLALNYSPWGIQLVPILLLLSAVTICLATLALVRQLVASRPSSRRIRIS